MYLTPAVLHFLITQMELDDVATEVLETQEERQGGGERTGGAASDGAW